MLLNPIVMTLCLAILLGFGTYTAFASSSEVDDADDDNSQEEDSPENEQTQQSQGTNQSQITWRTFNDRNNLFTVQYPSNWIPSGVAEADRAGPVDTFFSSPGANETTGAEIEFIEWAEPSVFSTPNESLEQEITSLQNDPTVTKFEIERPVECSKYTLNGLPACSYIYELRTADNPSLAVLVVDAIASDGTEYEVYYRSDFNSFEHFLPTGETMIKSFQTTGSGSEDTDFSLSNGGSSNTTGQQSTNLTGEDDFLLG
jgi:hypothetical protein